MARVISHENIAFFSFYHQYQGKPPQCMFWFTYMHIILYRLCEKQNHLYTLCIYVVA